MAASRLSKCNIWIGLNSGAEVQVRGTGLLLHSLPAPPKGRLESLALPYPWRLATSMVSKRVDWVEPVPKTSVSD